MNECWCFQTLSDAELSPAIPAGTPVTIEQFDTNSAVSAAVYIPYFGPVYPPGHALSFENNGNWWVIQPDYLTLEAAGAPVAPGDCAPAMDRVLAYLASATRAALKLGARDYVLSYAATLTQSNPGSDPLLYFSIVGQGPRVSRLLIPYVTDPIKPLGAFAITFSSNESGFEAREFAVIATNATTYGRGCGTAILANFPGLTTPGADPSPGNHRAALVSHVEIGNDDNEVEGVAWSYFATGLDLEGAGNLLVSDLVVTGPSGPSALTQNMCLQVPGQWSDESPAYLPICHVKIDGCYGPTLIGLQLVCAQTAISHVTTGLTPGGQGPQGFYMSKVNIDRVKTGFVHQQTDTGGNSVTCPVGMIQDSYFAFRDVGLDLSDIFKWQVHGCDFFNYGNGVDVTGDCKYGTVYDIHLRNANIVNIMGCRFSVPAAAYRYNIFVDADEPVSTGHANNVLIAHNQFGDDIAGDHGISAIVLTPSAVSVVIGVNAVIGQYTGSIVDDRTTTGQAVAPLGFPSTSTTNLPAILPSAYAGNTSPTVGSANVPWRQGFTYLQTVPQSSQPTKPGSGWTLYTDADGSLKAIYKDGKTIVTVALAPP